MMIKWMVLFCVLSAAVLVFASPTTLPTELTSSQAVFSTDPQSVNATEGSIVTFTCTITKALGVVFSSTWRSELYTHWEASYEQLGPQTFRGNLSMRVSAIDNYTFVWCEEYPFEYLWDVVISKPATVFVQGPLARVDDLAYEFISINTVMITWTPPFTLPGTHILGYNISSAIHGQKHIEEDFTSDSHYMLHLNNDVFNEICSGISVWVSGYNGLNGKLKRTTIQYDIVIRNLDDRKLVSTPSFVQDFFRIAQSKNLCGSSYYTGYQYSPMAANADPDISGSGLLEIEEIE